MGRHKKNRKSGDVVIATYDKITLVRKPTSWIYAQYWNDFERHSVEVSCRTKDEDEARKYAERLMKNMQVSLKTGREMTADDAAMFYHERKPRVALSVAGGIDNSIYGPARSQIGHLKLIDPKFKDTVNKIARARLFGTGKALDFTGRANRHRATHADPHTVRNFIDYIKRIVRFAAKHEVFAMAAAIEICNSLIQIDVNDTEYTRAPRIAKNERIGRDGMRRCIEAAAKHYTQYEQQFMPDGKPRHSQALRAWLLMYYGGGTRSARSGAMPWKNMVLDGSNPHINFADLDAQGITTSRNKRAIPNFQLARADFLLFLKQCKEQALSPYYMDALMARQAIYQRVNPILEQVLGLPGGGGHLLRKEVINEICDQCPPDLEALIEANSGVSFAMARKHYIIGDPWRGRQQRASSLLPSFFQPTPDAPDARVLAFKKTRP